MSNNRVCILKKKASPKIFIVVSSFSFIILNIYGMFSLKVILLDKDFCQ